jgi:DNA-binding transcriptional LysR family regulator
MLPTQFDPELSKRTFTVAATSYFCALLIPDLIALVRAQAPAITVRVAPIYSDLLTRLDEGAVDLALGAFARLPPRLLVEPLFREELVWIAANESPLVSARPSHDDLLSRPHLALDPIRTFTPQPHTGGGAFESDLPAEQFVPMELHGSELTPAIVYDTLTAIAVVAVTDLVAMVPRRLALVERARRGIAILETGEAGPGIDLVMISRTRSFPDAGHDWLREQVLKLATASAR